jgi:PAS domain S-box-containing protein
MSTSDLSFKNRGARLLIGYGAAMLLVAAAAAGRWGLGYAFGPMPLFLTFYPALMLAALIGGLGPGLVATTIGGLAALYLFVPPSGSLRIANTGDGVALGLFWLVGAFICVITDRLQKARAAQVSGEGRAKLETAMASMTDALFISDGEGRFLDFNDAFATFHRFKSREECSRTFAEYPDILDVFLPDGTPAPVDMWAVPRALRGEKVTNAEYTLRRKDTGETWVGSYSFGPIRDHDGAIVGSVVVGRDITEQKAAELAVKESEERFRTMADAIPQLAWIANGDGYIFWYNRRWYEYTGTAPIDMEGWGWQSVHDPDVLPQVLEQWGTSIATGMPFDMVFPLRGADGRFRQFLTRVMPLKDAAGRVTQWFGTNTDITESRRAEEELRRARNELEERVRERTIGLRRQADLLELAYEAVLVRDLESRITFWNARAEELYGWTKAEALGNVTHTLLRTVFPLPFDEYMAILTKEGRWHGELVHTTKDGRRIAVHSRHALQRDDAGSPLAILEINLDITEQKKADEEIKRYASQLELTNRELQDFAFVASHDLQEPLRKIQAFGDQIKTGYGDRLEGEGLDFLARMQNAAVRMQALIQALLNYSRVTTRARPFSPVDLSSVATEVAGDLEASIVETGGRVEIGALGVIEADPIQMRQLIKNLIGNALKFHGDAKPVVRIYGKSAKNNHYMIMVEDNGIGFDEKYLDRIFTPFQRLHGRGVYEGTGIGLAICRKIADRHGGTITARSAPGRGTTFMVTLPVRQPKGGA